MSDKRPWHEVERNPAGVGYGEADVSAGAETHCEKCGRPRYGTHMDHPRDGALDEAYERGRTEGYWQGVRDGQHKSSKPCPRPRHDEHCADLHWEAG